MPKNTLISDPASSDGPYVSVRDPTATSQENRGAPLRHPNLEGIGTNIPHQDLPPVIPDSAHGPTLLRPDNPTEEKRLPIATTRPAVSGTSHSDKRRRINQPTNELGTPSIHSTPPVRAPVSTGLHHPVAWANDIFAGSETASPADVQGLLQEAAEAAKNDFNEESALAWAQGYTFPTQYM